MTRRAIALWGTVALLVLAAALLAQQLVLGRCPFGLRGYWTDVWVALVHCCGAAYLPAAYLATLVSGREVLAELRGETGASGELPGEVDLPPFGRVGWRWLVAGGIGFLLTLFGPWLTESGRGSPLSFWVPGRWSPEVAWHRILGQWIGLWIGWFGLALVGVSRRLSRIARAMPTLQLFEAAPLRPFVRHGLNNGLTAAGVATFIGLLGLQRGFTPLLAVFGGLTVALVAVAIALPLLGVRSRIRQAKQAELAWCAAAVARARAGVRSRGAEERAGELADLLAYRRLVEGVDSWPLDTPTLRRVLLYLIIPLLTWSASAVVQAFAERAFLGR